MPLRLAKAVIFERKAPITESIVYQRAENERKGRGREERSTLIFDPAPAGLWESRIPEAWPHLTLSASLPLTVLCFLYPLCPRFLSFPPPI